MNKSVWQTEHIHTAESDSTKLPPLLLLLKMSMMMSMLAAGAGVLIAGEALLDSLHIAAIAQQAFEQAASPALSSA